MGDGDEDEPEPTNLSPEAIIAEFVNQMLANKTATEMRNMTAGYFITMKLLNKEGKWSDPLLSAIREELLLSTLCVGDFESLMREMMDNASKNPAIHEYLVEVCKRVRQSGCEQECLNTIIKESPRYIPEFLAYSMHLQNLTSAMRRNHKVASAVRRIWQAARPGFWGILRKGISGCVAIKYYSVKIAVEKMFDCLTNQQMDPGFCSSSLPLNIMEASILDTFCGRADNAYAGTILAKHGPGRDAHGGPSRITVDGNGMELGMPLAQAWADLYQSWNLAICLQNCSLHYISKLLIPVVSGYQDTAAVRARLDRGEILPSKAKEYVHRRALALYVKLHFAVFREANDPRVYHWKAGALARLFGKINAKHAKNYARKVENLGLPVSVYSRIWSCTIFCVVCVTRALGLCVKALGLCVKALGLCVKALSL